MPAPTANPMLRLLALAALAALLGACASIKPAPIVTPTPPVLHSVAQADSALAAAAAERAAFEARFIDSERACYQRFFVNACLDDAKETRRVALARVRAVEVEAGRYKRQAEVDERDRAIAAAEKEDQAREAKRVADEAAAPPPAPAPVVAPQPLQAAAPGDRVARHAAKLRQQAAQDAAGAAKRAENVAAYNKRRADSEQRQRDVAARKADKAAKAKASASAGSANSGQVPK
jgi:colicin import membrane protein